jgi:hypothetical protein
MSFLLDHMNLSQSVPTRFLEYFFRIQPECLHHVENGTIDSTDTLEMEMQHQTRLVH